MARTRVDASQLRRLGARAHAAGGELKDDAMTALAVATAEAQLRAKIIAPKYTGEFASGIETQGPRFEKTASGVRLFDAVFAPAPHAMVVEGGRGAGLKPPPLAPIERWVALQVGRGVLDISWTGRKGDAAVTAAAIVISRSIGRKGIQAFQVLERAVLAAGPRLERELESVLARWADKFEGG